MYYVYIHKPYISGTCEGKSIHIYNIPTPLYGLHSFQQMVEPTKTQHYTYTNTSLNWHPHPTSHIYPVFPPYLRKPSDSCNSWFCSIVFAKACSNEPCGDSSPPCDKGSIKKSWGAPKKHIYNWLFCLSWFRVFQIAILKKNGKFPSWHNLAEKEQPVTMKTTTTTTTTKIRIMELPNNCRKG